MKISKILSISISLVLLIVFSFVSGAEAMVQQSDLGGNINGAFIKSTYGNSQYSMKIEDYFMNPKDAHAYANKTDVSIPEGAAWLGAGFIPGIGPYVTITGFIDGSRRSLLSSKIRYYADKNEGVHLTVLKDSYWTTSFVVKYWDRKTVAPFAVPQPKLQKVVARYFK